MNKQETIKLLQEWMRSELTSFNVAAWLYTIEVGQRGRPGLEYWCATATNATGRSIDCGWIELGADGRVVGYKPFEMIADEL